MSKKRICLLAVGLTLLLAAGFFLALPRTLFDEPFSATVWSRDGRLLSAKVAPDGQWRFFPTDSVPGKFRTAITTYEDKRFDRHFGVDPLALARAVGQNLAAGRIESGASTLTMQTIRLSRGGKPRTFGEKFVEAVLALRLEMRCSKEEILALYAAHAPFGGNVVGLESASWYYFGRSARDLSWAESALLAVLPNAPSLIHMKRNRERLREKRDRLLDRIRSGGHIDSLTCALAKLEPLPEAPEPMPMEAMHLLGKMRTGALRSTLDADLQGRVNALARRYNAQYRGNRINNLAVVVMDVRSGEVLAYAGNVYDPGTGVREPASTSSPRGAAAAACSNRSSTPGCSTTARRFRRCFSPTCRPITGISRRRTTTARSTARFPPTGWSSVRSTSRRCGCSTNTAGRIFCRWCRGWVSARSTAAPTITGCR